MPALIPIPVYITTAPGTLKLDAETRIVASAGAEPEAQLLADALAPALGRRPEVMDDASTPTGRFLALRLSPELKHLGPEGYRLVVTPDSAVATAAKPAGLFYACQTLRQLLPPATLAADAPPSTLAADTQPPTGGLSLPCVTVEDQPRFVWRGLLLDVCRHFTPVSELKRTIDVAALHKVNRLHLHLTDDQGWRLEIRRYPRLTTVGSRRVESDGTPHSGFYTQAEMRDVIDYAARRHVTIVPEMEMPGHSRAALASYPHLGCTGGPYEVINTWGIYNDVFCPGRETTFQFLENVMEEVVALFPSQYIHIGGDECPKEQWKACPHCRNRIRQNGLKDEHELQSYFVRRMDAWLAARGRRLIGWDEILEGGLAPGAVVQSWRGTEGGVVAASAGHDVIMSPNPYCYFDYGYAVTPLEKSYSYEPIPVELPADKVKHVLGLEGAMWTEVVANPARRDFQIYPRMTALAEVGWSPKERRSFADFSLRLETHARRMETLGVKMGGPPDLSTATAVLVGTWTPDTRKSSHTLELDVTPHIAAAGPVEAFLLPADGSVPAPVELVVLLEDGTELQRDRPRPGNHEKVAHTFQFRLTQVKPGAKYGLRIRFHDSPTEGAGKEGTIYLRAPATK